MKVKNEESAPSLLAVKLERYWEEPFAKLPGALQPLVKQAFPDPSWDAMDVEGRRMNVAQKSAENKSKRKASRMKAGRLLAADEKAEREQLFRMEQVTEYEFRLLTGIRTGNGGLYRISQSCVELEPVSESEKAKLTKRELTVYLEGARHRIAFPCTRAQFIAFVIAVGHPFTLPDGYAEMVVGELPVTETPEAALDDTPAKRRAKLDITGERGCRRRILEEWDAIEKEYGNTADGRQVKRVLDREPGVKPPALKTVQNHLARLRKEKLIP